MPTRPSTILLAEEHEITRVFLADNLAADGYRVLLADGRAKAMALLRTTGADLVLLDVNGETLGVIDAVRGSEGLAGAADPDTPLLVLSGDADRLQRVRLLERGGDDVVAKPFSYVELRARIVALLRRSQMRRAPQLLRAGSVEVDLAGREVRVSGRRVRLSAMEYDLLVALAAEPTRVFTRRELMRSVWGTEAFGRTRTLDSHAYRLRRKLRSDDQGQEGLVVNVWGIGYRLLERVR